MSNKIKVYEDGAGNMRVMNDDNMYVPLSSRSMPSSEDGIELDDNIRTIMPLVAPVEIALPEQLCVPVEFLPKNCASMYIKRDTIISIYQQLCHFAPLDAALNYNGIKPSMFYKLMAWASENPQSAWYQVFELMNRGFAQPMLVSLNTIAKASQTSWQASAWWIEKVAGIKPVVITRSPTGDSDKAVEATRERTADDIRSDILQRLTGLTRSLPVSSTALSADNVADDKSK